MERILNSEVLGKLSMKLTTTDKLEGEKVEKELGIVSGEIVMGANLGRDILFSLKNLIGGRAESYEKALEKGRHEAIGDLKKEAKKLGADAVIGIKFDYGEMGEGAMLITCTGTAVKLAGKEKKKED